ncbi:uncharacterized protein LOC134794811 isoform X2 [Cydia splendana]|uniref:uncharacterized protein LOC134794811 isoform X2 n=1 Tax=Cydia splendana TaxID=1100963 RepID=UPI00300CFE7B
MWKLICISFWTYVILTEGVTDKPSVHWWCDEIECYYSDTDTLPFEEKCDSNKSIPYRFNSTTGTCELNLIGLLLSFKVLNNRLGAVVAEKTRKSNDIIFQRVINAGIIFAGFASESSIEEKLENNRKRNTRTTNKQKQAKSWKKRK